MPTLPAMPKIGAFDKNPVEILRDSGSDIAKTVRDSLKNEIAQETNALWKQLLKGGAEGNSKKQTADHSGVSSDETEIFSKEKKTVHIEAAMDYRGEILHATERAEQQENSELRYKIEEITIELKKLSKSSKQLEVAFKDVAMERTPQHVGKYHLNFFEWVLSTLRSARIRVQEASSWTNVVSSKKEKKGYWNSAKKHGTTFTLSSERVVAQQVG